jgi:hypothetical protein
MAGNPRRRMTGHHNRRSNTGQDVTTRHSPKQGRADDPDAMIAMSVRLLACRPLDSVARSHLETVGSDGSEGFGWREAGGADGGE